MNLCGGRGGAVAAIAHTPHSHRVVLVHHQNRRSLYPYGQIAECDRMKRRQRRGMVVGVGARRHMCGSRGQDSSVRWLCKASPESNDSESKDNKKDDDVETEGKKGGKSRRRRNKRAATPESITLDDLNPISMGRKSRAVFDDVWSQLQRIGGPSRTVTESLPVELSDFPETFESPQAQDTTVLVAGATGRVGKVLARKLLLRGYSVKALVRRRSGNENDWVSEGIPQSVEVVEGDLGDYKACRKAVEGVDKVLFCAAARSTLTADLNRVDAEGVGMLVRALQDARNAKYRKEGKLAPSAKIDIADFKNEYHQEAWDIDHVGAPPVDMEKTGFYAENRRKAINVARDFAQAIINEEDFLVFEGAVYTRDGYALVGADVNAELRLGLSTADGLVLRILGDNHPYTMVVETEDGRTFTSRFTARVGFSTVRLPFSLFVPDAISEDPSNDILNPGSITHIGIKFEAKTKMLDQVTLPGQDVFDSSGNRFNLQVDWIKALPGGEETDFILVSCGGSQSADWGLSDDSSRDRVISAKRRGENLLRSSGLGYTIVRPGALIEEAGGYKALVFDQGNRITQPISCADVADVCLKALHDPLARNKTFEVCWEYTPETGLEQYELVAHLPDKANNYLSPALASLQRNT